MMGFRDLEELLDAIDRTKGGALYHVTNVSDLESIYDVGIFSRRQRLMAKILSMNDADRDIASHLDENARLDDYVFLCFHNNPIISKREGQKKAIIPVDPRIIFTPKCKIALGPSNSSRTQTYLAAQAPAQMDRDVFLGNYESTVEKWKIAMVFRYEVLIPKFVPTSYLAQPLMLGR